MPIELRDVVVPDFGVPHEAPRIPAATYEKRCRDAYARAGCDWLVVYADREHLANIAFLSGYDPRFEEALLLLGPQSRRILVVGNEGEAYAPLAGLPGLDIALAQSLSLMGQDRSLKPDLAAVLREAGHEPRPDDRARGLEIFRAGGMGGRLAGPLRSPLSGVDAEQNCGRGGGLEGRHARAHASGDGAAFDDRRRSDRLARVGRRARLGRRLADRERNAARPHRTRGGEPHGLRRRGPFRARDVCDRRFESSR